MSKKAEVARKGRPPRRVGEQLRKNRTFRIRGPLDAFLANAAERSGRSVSEEIEYRLEKTFTEETAYGGVAMQDIAIRMAVAFSTAGEATAASSGHPSWTAAEWILDTACYRAATFAVIARLLKSYPGADLDELLLVADDIPLMVHALKAEVATDFVNRGPR
jgi:hypothetical protein